MRVVIYWIQLASITMTIDVHRDVKPVSHKAYRVLDYFQNLHYKISTKSNCTFIIYVFDITCITGIIYTILSIPYFITQLSKIATLAGWVPNPRLNHCLSRRPYNDIHNTCSCVGATVTLCGCNSNLKDAQPN